MEDLRSYLPPWKPVILTLLLLFALFQVHRMISAYTESVRYFTKTTGDALIGHQEALFAYRRYSSAILKENKACFDKLNRVEDLLGLKQSMETE